MSRKFKLVEFGGESILTTVTASGCVVDEWISHIYCLYRTKLTTLIVGLDTEWCPFGYQPVAVLQLCVGRRCLIFQLRCADDIPESLFEFLDNENFVFVGKEVARDAHKLEEEYNLRVARTKDIASWAAEIYGKDDPFQYNDIKRMGLKRLASWILKEEMEKSKKVTLSKWYTRKLTNEQIIYACIDAFVSFKIGLELSSKEASLHLQRFSVA